LTKGYSGADMRNLCAEASLIPIRSITDITQISADTLRPTDMNDFLESLKLVTLILYYSGNIFRSKPLFQIRT